MARRATLTQEALIALGGEKLAKLILDEAQGNAPFKRIVAAALAGAKGPAAVAALIDRRLASLERARGTIGWDKRKAFAADLKATVSTIVDELGGADPAAAVERMLRLLRAAEHVFERVDDSSGSLQAILMDAADVLPALVARMAGEDRIVLVERVTPLLLGDDDGLIDVAVHGMIPVLAGEERAVLDLALDRTLASSKATRDWQQQARRDRLLQARQAIADAAADVDAFIALEVQRSEPMQDSLGIAERLLQAGRTAEALQWVRRPRPPGLRAMTLEDVADGAAATDVFAHRQVRLEIAILAARKDTEAAQQLRWTTFETSLDADLLRAYVAALPDFEDEEALDRAFAHVAAHPQRHRALAFFMTWPRLDLASKLVLRHIGAWDGRFYEVLAPATEVLEHDHPVAAIVLYRALIDDILERGRSPAYGHATRYLARLALIHVDDVAASGLADHRAYKDGLRRSHGRKYGFWSLVQDEG